MSLRTSKTILKIFGIFDIICGIILLALAAVTFAGVSQTGAEELASDSELSEALLGMGVLAVLGLIALLEGIFSIRGAKDPAKIMPAWIFALIGAITAVGGFFAGGSSGGSVGTLIINIVIFVAANNIRKSRKSN